jgi:hypothetical protein
VEGGRRAVRKEKEKVGKESAAEPSQRPGFKNTRRERGATIRGETRTTMQTTTCMRRIGKLCSSLLYCFLSS